MNQMDVNNSGSGTRRKLTLALAAYAGIAALAGFTLDGNLRLAIWLWLGALAVKTWINSLSDANG
jgi:hypothetical protein